MQRVLPVSYSLIVSGISHSREITVNPSITAISADCVIYTGAPSPAQSFEMSNSFIPV